MPEYPGIDAPINQYTSYIEQTDELQTAWEDIVGANNDAVAAMQDKPEKDYKRMLGVLQDTLKTADMKYSKYGKLNYQELVRHDFIHKLDKAVAMAVKEGYSNITKRAINDQRILAERTYGSAVMTINQATGISASPKISGKAITEILQKPWDGISLNERLYLRQQALGVTLRAQIVRDTMGTGATYREIMEHVQKVMVRDYASLGKMMEEAAHQFQSDAEQQALNDLKEEDIQITKTWVTAGDNRVREAHEYLDGMTVDAQEMFEVPEGDYRGYKADGPGLFGEPALDFNCRCYVVAGVRPREKE